MACCHTETGGNITCFVTESEEAWRVAIQRQGVILLVLLQRVKRLGVLPYRDRGNITCSVTESEEAWHVAIQRQGVILLVLL